MICFVNKPSVSFMCLIRTSFDLIYAIIRGVWIVRFVWFDLDNFCVTWFMRLDFDLYNLCFRFMQLVFSVYATCVFGLCNLCFRFMQLVFSVYATCVFWSEPGPFILFWGAPSFSYYLCHIYGFIFISFFITIVIDIGNLFLKLMLFIFIILPRFLFIFLFRIFKFLIIFLFLFCLNN